MKQAVEAEQKYMQEIASNCGNVSNDLQPAVECTSTNVQEVSTSANHIMKVFFTLNSECLVFSTEHALGSRKVKTATRASVCSHLKNSGFGIRL